MKEQLTQYVNLLFAGSEDAEDIRQEILQNTLDRYDDLIDQGKTPEAAYRLAISGIGDINEIIHTGQPNDASAPYTASPVYSSDPITFSDWDPVITKLIRAIAIGLYILCPIPLILLDAIGLDVVGVSILLVMVAVATVLLIVFSKKRSVPRDPIPADNNPKKALKKSIRSLIDTIGLVIYFIISFATGAWHITWLIFPIIGAVNGLVKACLDLKEHE